MANLTFPTNPTNGQKYTSNGKVFEYSSSTGRWSATRLQVLGDLSSDFTIDAPTLGVSLSTVALDTVGANVYITYTVDQDVKATLTTSGLENTTATLHQTNNTIVVTAGATEFANGQINLVVSNGRNTDTEVIDVSAVYETIQGLSTPSSWTELGSLGESTSDNTYAAGPAMMVVVNDHLYTVSGKNLITVDVSNKSSPTRVDAIYDFQIGHFNNTEATQLLINIGNYIMGTGNGGGGGTFIYSYDISTPDSPSYEGRFAIGGFAVSQGKFLYEDGSDYAFLASNDQSEPQVISIDVSDMSNISEADSITNSDMPDNELRFPKLGELYGDYVIVAVNATDGTYTIPTFTIIDVSDPTSLSLHGSVDLPAYYGISGGDGNTQPTASAFRDGIMYLFFQNHDLVQAWDFSSNILSPTKVAEYSSATLLNGPVGAFIDMDYIYVLCDTRVEIIDISSAASGTITHVASSPTNNPRGLALLDNYVYVNDFDIDGDSFVGDLKIYS